MKAMKTTSSERSISSIQTMTAFGIGRGMAVRDCLAGTGLRPDDLNDPVMNVSIEQEFGVARNLLRQLGDVPGLGLEVGQRYHFTALGAVGFAVASCASMYQAFEVGLRYMDLTFAFTAFHLEEEGDECRIVLTDDGVPPDLHRFALERAVGVLQVLAGLFGGGAEVGRRLQFGFPRPGDVRLYETLLGTTPTFDAPRTLIVLDAAAMKRPMLPGSALALHQAEEQCRRLLAERRARSGLAARVCHHLALRGGRPLDMNAMAAELCLSARTLRRRLQEEGATYLALCDEVRKTFAEELLALPNLSIEQIADRLGYSEAAGFIHAFKRWTGMTPRAFRSGGKESGVAAGND
jgi:AraC-like DNA-binding protein